MSSSGDFKQYVNDNLEKDMRYKATFDGENANILVKNMDNIYYTKLDKEDLLELLNAPVEKRNLTDSLKDLLKEQRSKPKSRSKKKKKKEKKDKKNKKYTKRKK